MSKVTVIGTGNMGSAIASIAVKGGADVQLLGRNQEKVAAAAQQVGAAAGQVGDAITGDIVVLAVPYSVLAELAEKYEGQLEGKILVDVTNPVDFTTFNSLVVPADSSAAAELQVRVPAAKVVKAFNTNFAATLATGKVGGNDTTVLIAGDDADAMQALVEVITAGGVNAVLVGSLFRARELEALGFLQLTLAAQEIIGWTGGFAVQD